MILIQHDVVYRQIPPFGHLVVLHTLAKSPMSYNDHPVDNIQTLSLKHLVIWTQHLKRNVYVHN